MTAIPGRWETCFRRGVKKTSMKEPELLQAQPTIYVSPLPLAYPEHEVGMFVVREAKAANGNCSAGYTSKRNWMLFKPAVVGIRVMVRLVVGTGSWEV
jgi:hypothetical protein